LTSVGLRPGSKCALASIAASQALTAHIQRDVAFAGGKEMSWSLRYRAAVFCATSSKSSHQHLKVHALYTDTVIIACWHHCAPQPEAAALIQQLAMTLHTSRALYAAAELEITVHLAPGPKVERADR
jgi:hypothetical protein